MHACVAVTIDGFGKVWGFDSKAAAARHPLIQIGDPILCGPSDVPRSWFSHQVGILLRDVLGDEEEGMRVMGRIDRMSLSEKDQHMVQMSDMLWDRLVAAASPPPADPAEICRLVIADRDAYDQVHPVHRELRRRQMTDAAKTDTAAKPKAEAKAPTVKKIAGHPETSKITFGSDKDGKAYGPDNNPKRAGSKAAASFALYNTTNTLAQLVEKGVNPADISWDLKHGFIKIAG